MPIYLGSHISLSSPDYFLFACKEAHSFGENCFMFYTGAPQNSVRKPLEGMKIEEGKRYCEEHGIALDKCVIHAPYIINLAYPLNEDAYSFGIEFLKEELRRAKAFGIPNLVLHPGSKKELGLEEAITGLANALNLALEESEGVSICIETMAGKGNEIGRDFTEVSAILKGVKKQENIGVCLDTCHIFDAGYDVSDIDSVLSEFDRLIGLGKLRVIHLNDSKTFRGSHKDRHENLGYGAIGFETLCKYVYDPRLKDMPKILETPYVGKLPPYKKEIELLRGQQFEEGWREKLEETA